ncbi:conserved Plasmodium protein, unknown function [Plasmodium knowlesi strain H]|uniref:Uncharacterized protein n=3 Tax=Plasmodium knowlesi TaxID=5850 RepID=A0A5K1U0Z8_PLAKH|nr:conserved Plasmodium protein, unknown function [Plasmodium knowlesi strain H]OTN67304.1 Uncharacterized protein PKNOH_S06431600 [Plasmodium knowlesi]CAA9987586.1 conserved Plasmodium protein, unknown function [Plasmodium knowlesi strain H]SBO27019.1 conserved Plasmodium protein, unknown function [Plasmodium knowlesi strain H]SBO29223.1 conserved Plasmodium protein, unknown function [Plasmodium knowlesi strain H]VVS77060.1 conserved Plasmodium protein, unknown function [Plasmodium knowlesi s|eukprot:XP_002258588.1 hypothetical protein, conserved in Plasmodium species [Plasmodium knowlesi strain H]
MNGNDKSITSENLLNEKKNVDSTTKSGKVECDANNQSDMSSEFEFNFKKHITDSFEVKNKGLFRLSLGNKVNYKSNSANHSESVADIGNNKKHPVNNRKNNEFTKPKQLSQTKGESLLEKKDEVITNLKKHIIVLTNQFEKKLSNIENAQKDNFQLEQIYKNKYYLDMKKEKSKAIEIYAENEELLKKIDYYNEFFQELKKKIRCLRRNTLTLIEHFGTAKNINFFLKNVEDISSLMQTIEQKCFQKNTHKVKEKSEKIKVDYLGDIKNENKKKKKKPPMKNTLRIATPSYKNHKIPARYTTEKQENAQKVCINKEIYLLNDSFLNHYERTNKRNDNVNSPRRNKNTLGHKNKLGKSNYLKLGNTRTENNIDSKKRRKVTNFTIRMKNVSPENSDDILHLLRKTRRINYLLRNYLKTENDKTMNYPKENINSHRNDDEPFISGKTKECILRSNNNRGSALQSSMLKREYIA